MYPDWLNVQIDDLVLKYSKDLGPKKVIAMVQCWANMWIMGASYPRPVHDIIDDWEEPTYPEWKDDWPEEDSAASFTPLGSSCGEIGPFKILNREEKDDFKGATQELTPPPPPATAPPLDFYASATPSPNIHQTSKWNNDKIPKKKRSGKKNWKQKKNKKPSASRTEPLVFYGREHNSSQSVTPEKTCHPVTTCYFFAQKLRKELTFKELDGSSVDGSPINERRTVLYLEKRRLCEAKGGKKKARRLECATQAIPTLSKLLAEKGRSAKKRGKYRKPTQPQSDEKVYQDDCELMRALDIQEKSSRQARNTKKKQPVAEKNSAKKRVQKRRKAPRGSKASIDLLYAWAKHSKMKLKFLQNKENSKLTLGEEIKVSIWLSGTKIGQGMHELGDTYQAKLSAAEQAVKWLERKSETFKEFKNSRNAKSKGAKGRRGKKKSTPGPVKSRKGGQKPSPKVKRENLATQRSKNKSSVKKDESLSLSSGSPSKSKSVSAKSTKPTTKVKRVKGRERFNGKKDSPKRRHGSGKKGGSSKSKRKPISEDLGNTFTEEGKINKPKKSPKKAKPCYREGDL